MWSRKRQRVGSVIWGRIEEIKVWGIRDFGFVNAVGRIREGKKIVDSVDLARGG